MARREQASSGPVEKVKEALAQPAGPRPRPPAVEVSEGFRSARSALSQITADLERLRRHAASLVKTGHRPAK